MRIARALAIALGSAVFKAAVLLGMVMALPRVFQLLGTRAEVNYCDPSPGLGMLQLVTGLG